jgi:hypothetical protein
MSFMLWRGTNIKNFEALPGSFEDLWEKCKPINEAIEKMYEDVKSIAKRRHEANRKRWERYYAPPFSIGDYVLVGRRTPKAHKLQLHWQGPYVIIGSRSTLVYQVNLVGMLLKADERYSMSVHASRLRMFADKDLDVTKTLVESAVHDLQFYDIEKIAGWRVSDDTGEIELRIHWLGFEASERTWEPIAQVSKDQGRLVKKWLSKNHKKHPLLRGLLDDIIADAKILRLKKIAQAKSSKD